MCLLKDKINSELFFLISLLISRVLELSYYPGGIGPQNGELTDGADVLVLPMIWG